MAAIARRPLVGSDNEYQWLVKIHGDSEYKVSPYRITESEVRDFFDNRLLIHCERLEITKRKPKATFVLLYTRDM